MKEDEKKKAIKDLFIIRKLIEKMKKKKPKSKA
jgi:hypothetical protein